MDNPETLASLSTQDTGEINVRENRGQSRMGNPETLVIMSTEDTGEINVRENRTIKNRQSKDTGNTEYARHRRNKR